MDTMSMPELDRIRHVGELLKEDILELREYYSDFVLGSRHGVHMYLLNHGTMLASTIREWVRKWENNVECQSMNPPYINDLLCILSNWDDLVIEYLAQIPLRRQ
jgi:hypothetical protein